MEGGWKHDPKFSAKAHYFIHSWSLCGGIRDNPYNPFKEGDNGWPHCKVCERSLASRLKYEEEWRQRRIAAGWPE